MPETNERALNMLNTALQMEEKGFEFYRKAADECKEETAREVFSTLMKDEVLHVKRIKAIYAGMEGGGAWSNEWKEFRVEHGDLALMFRAIAEKHGSNVRADSSDLEAVEVGIGFESQAVKFYSEQLPAAADPVEKAFVEAMIAEERSHHAALTDMKLYLTDPAAWFAGVEGSGTDGG
ncbi:MAG: ferritin family protein [Deltaproteobacteria bacterium]|nr:ferritin family protein [Deltaproteobacteria bacterium]